jgi:transposase
MMGRQAKGRQEKLFYKGISLEQRVRADHPLRKIDQLIDFDFTYQEVAGSYGIKGNVSVPPPVILKLMLLLVFYNVRSERELMATVPERNDWIWFLGLNLDDPVPDHSVLSKARARWGSAIFKHFFEKIVSQCVEAGLVDGSKIFMDSSLIQADASIDSVINVHCLKRYLKPNYEELEARLDGLSQGPETQTQLNRTHVSTTDPDASIVRKRNRPSQVSFKTHRAVDEQSEIITATKVTPGDVNEGHLLPALIDQHAENTSAQVEVVVADSQYGTVKNYLECLDRGIKAHITPLKDGQAKKGAFSEQDFRYDSKDDTYVCPAGNRLKCQSFDKGKEVFQYKCGAKICRKCPMRDQCTTSQKGRTIKRHLRHDEARQMRERALSRTSKRDLRTRQHLMERSFARAVPLGFKRARWRGLWRVQIQEYLTATIQNIMSLVRYVKEPRHAMAMAMKKATDNAAQEKGIKIRAFFRQIVLYISIFSAAHLRLFALGSAQTANGSEPVQT